jgi:hypothetical protein
MRGIIISAMGIAVLSLLGLPASAQSVGQTQQETNSQSSTTLSLSEINAFRTRISQCWHPPPGIDAGSAPYVVLRILFKPDGSLAHDPVLVEGPSSAIGPALFESARQALLQCQPFAMLRPEHYEQWKDLELKFDARLLPPAR